MIKKQDNGGRKNKRPKDAEGRMALREHLTEARNRLFKSLIALALATVAGFFVYDEILALLIEPVNAAGGAVNYVAVMSPFDIMLKVALFVGVVVSSPVWIYQIWAFIVPGLKKKERRLGYSFAAAAAPLFIGGVVMAYFILPFALEFFIGLAAQNSEILVSIDTYLPFIFRLLLAFGLAMLVPVLMVGLNMAGVLPARLILKNWRITVFLIALVAAMAAPGGDAITMFALAGPLFITFAAATLICYLNDRKRAKKLSAAEAENERMANESARGLDEPPA